MFNSKLASLEARIARLESSLKNKTASSSEWEDPNYLIMHIQEFASDHVSPAWMKKWWTKEVPASMKNNFSVAVEMMKTYPSMLQYFSESIQNNVKLGKWMTSSVYGKPANFKYLGEELKNDYGFVLYLLKRLPRKDHDKILSFAGNGLKAEMARIENLPYRQQEEEKENALNRIQALLR